MEWGAANGGRDDLGAIRKLGGNAVRLYASIGQEKSKNKDHSKFLDYAHSQGIHVLVGVDSGNTRACTKFDCHDVFDGIMTASFQQGFLQHNESTGPRWHPAIAMVILLNEPDFLGADPNCPKGPDKKGLAWCRVKAVLSALDGTLTAEKKAGIKNPVNLTTTWSFGVFESIDKKVNGPGYFGFQDMEASTMDPSIADGYKPKNDDLRTAYMQRWVHGVNVQAPFDYVYETISAQYGPYSKAPWFIGELGEGNQDFPTMSKDLKDCVERAKQDENFLGAATFQFQTAYQKGGSETHFGLFALGKTKLGEENVCLSLPDGGEHCETHEVYCTTPVLDFLPVALRNRAAAVAKAWNGTLPKSRCKDSDEVLTVSI